MKTLRLVGLAGLVFGASNLAADVITDWNSTITDIVRLEGGPPTPITRWYALAHGAMYDAVNSFERTHEPLKFQLDAPVAGSADAAAAGAAHRVLTTLFPEHTAMLDQRLANSLASIPDSPARTASLALGSAIASSLITLHDDDGSTVMNPYSPNTGSGHWRPTPPTFHTDPFNPDWGNVRPWIMGQNWQATFRPPLPPALGSPEYATAFNDVKLFGRADSTARTPEQTETAWFWANDRDGSQKPPGQLHDITQVISRNQNLSMPENARLFALLSIGMADAGIAAWDAKYYADQDFWRPVAGIREAADDGNPDTAPDPDWFPLSDMDTPAGPGIGIHQTPPFPAYISGHATFGALHAAVLREFFGRDDLTFTITSDDTPGVFRTYHSLDAIARENGRSRVYLGVHWQFDADFGYSTGTAIGQFTVRNSLLPVPEPYSISALSAVALLLRRRRASQNA